MIYGRGGNTGLSPLPGGPIALKMAVSVGIGMLVGMELKWSHKEARFRTFVPLEYRLSS